MQDVSQAAEDVILAQWTVRGILRLPWRAKLFFNGNSTYKLNQAGWIFEHIDTWDCKPREILQQFWQRKEKQIRSYYASNRYLLPIR